jgi:hypothetical protein
MGCPMNKFAFLLLALPMSAFAVGDVAATGTCPGTLSIDITGGTPGGAVALVTADAAGTFVVPAGPCAGATLDLDASSARLRVIRNFDASGNLSITPTVGSPVCGLTLQALDIATCTVTTTDILGDVPAMSTTVQDIQGGVVAVDTEVAVSGLSVTGKTNLGFFAQETGTTDAGMYVYAGTDWELTYGPVAIGDMVNVQGLYIEYFGFTEISLLDSGAPAIQNMGAQTPLAPTLVTVADIVANGEAYESMLVRVESVTVAVETNQYGEFNVGDGTNEVVVDDLMYGPTVAPLLGASFDAIQGPLYYSFGAFKIVPRDAADIVVTP